MSSGAGCCGCVIGIDWVDAVGFVGVDAVDTGVDVVLFVLTLQTC